MASPFLGLNIGGNALNAFQSSVDTIANNMANVNTKGYTRQETQLESTLAIRVYSRYGSVGTGVQATSVEQIRNQFYDDKFWANNANTGYYDKELYYLEQIQEVMKDDSTQTGFATLFSRLFNNLETLKTNAADPSVRNQFIHQAQNFCTYFNMISNSLSTIQEDCNEEIKNTVEEINNIARKISVLNREINTIEVRGGTANELRDKRALLLDRLSEICKLDTREYKIPNINGGYLGGTNFTVMIDGNVLVDGNDYWELECVALEESQNQTDIDGLYTVQWKDTGTRFINNSESVWGSLNALFMVRDGNNADNLRGMVEEVTVGEGSTITMSQATIKNLNKLAIPEKGELLINNKYYPYNGWSANLNEDGTIRDYTFYLKEELSDNAEDLLTGEKVGCGKSVNSMGIPYYQSQINEFIRTFTELFNEIEESGQTLDGEPMGSFFNFENRMGDNFEFERSSIMRKRLEKLQRQQAIENGELEVEEDFEEEEFEGEEEEDAESYLSIRSWDDSYYKLTASGMCVNATSLRDPNYFATTANIVDGTDAYELAEKLAELQSNVVMFRGDKANTFLETLLSDVAVDTGKVETNQTNFNNVASSLQNMRTSYSGVDEDEEAMNLIKFQNSYNLAAKVISVMDEMYNKLINDTGMV